MMTPEEEQMLALLLKKQNEAQGLAPVIQLIPGSGERNAMADSLTEFAAMARAGKCSTTRLSWSRTPATVLFFAGDQSFLLLSSAASSGVFGSNSQHA